MIILHDPLGSTFELVESRDAGPAVASAQRARLRWMLEDPRSRETLCHQLQLDPRSVAVIRGLCVDEAVERLCEILDRRGVMLREQPREHYAQVGASSVPREDEEDAVSLTSMARTWIALELVDGSDEPVPGVRYEIRLPSGVVVTGRTDADGRGYVSDTPPGQCTITLPDYDRECWGPA